MLQTSSTHMTTTKTGQTTNQKAKPTIVEGHTQGADSYCIPPTTTRHRPTTTTHIWEASRLPRCNNRRMKPQTSSAPTTKQIAANNSKHGGHTRGSSPLHLSLHNKHTTLPNNGWWPCKHVLWSAIVGCLTPLKKSRHHTSRSIGINRRAHIRATQLIWPSIQQDLLPCMPALSLVEKTTATTPLGHTVLNPHQLVDNTKHHASRG